MRFALVALVASCLPHGKPPPTGGGSGGVIEYRDTAIQGSATFPPQHVDEPSVKGKVIDLTSRADGDHERWNLVIEDEAEQGHSYAIELPPQVVPSVATGSTITVDAEAGKISVIDDQAALVLAVGRLPAGWTAETSRVHAPDGAIVELATVWRSFELGGASYLGTAAGDVAIVRVR
ncbi:MAG TPA: hypothetical protein VFQ65_03555 [Kofleriaceae bacterium]|nr:hypothetical protein [Kofleriaceae bacterium]